MRRSLAFGLVLLGLLLVPAPVLATALGGCTVTGTSTSGGTVDLTGATTWHLRSTDHLTVTATAANPQVQVHVSVYALGYPIPFFGDSGWGSANGTADFDAADLAKIGRSIVVAGESSGGDGACSGEVQIVIDDVDPLATPLGLGSALVTAIGLVLLLAGIGFAFPGGRLASLLGLAFGAAGGATLLGQIADTPSASFAPSAFVLSIPGPLQVAHDLPTLGLAAVATAIVVLLLPFPGELFNKTVEEHADEFRAYFAGLPLVGPAVRAELAHSGWRRNPLGLLVMLALAGLIASALSPTFGPDLAGAATWLATTVALLVVVRAQWLPKRRMQKRENGEKGSFSMVLGALPVAVLCVLVSRVTGYLPGYLYGLLLGYEFSRRLAGDGEGRAVHAGAWWMLGLGLVSWVMLDAARSPGLNGTIGGTLLATVLSMLTIAGIEGVVFALLPMRFLLGVEVFRWSKVRWGILYAAGLFTFMLVVLNPANGFAETANPAALPTAVALFVVFAAVSIATWAHFRFRSSPANPGTA